MTPISFPQQTLVFAEGQSEYQPLPAYRTDDGIVVSCWKLSWWELLRLALTRKIWMMQLTFNSPVQPQLPSVESPFV